MRTNAIGEMSSSSRSYVVQGQHGRFLKDLPRRRIERKLHRLGSHSRRILFPRSLSTKHKTHVGAGKYGFYELFKKKYSDIVGEEAAYKYRTFVYLAASASAEVIADVLLCPWEAIKVRMQTTIPPFAKGTLEGWNKITATEGIAGYPP